MIVSFDKETIEKVLKVYNSIPKERFSGVDGEWVFLGKYGAALIKEGVSYNKVNGEVVKLRKFVEYTDLFDIKEIRNNGVHHYISLKKEWKDILSATTNNQPSADDAKDVVNNTEGNPDNETEKEIEEESPDIIEARSLFEDNDNEQKEAEEDANQPKNKEPKPHVITEESLRLFNLLRETKEADWKTFSKRDYVGVWRSIIEKYPETAHFIYELLQNADDAQATEASILLCRDKLIFKHNGQRQFTLTDANDNEGLMGDINSITSVACSTKKDEGNTIGKFGVGFKSTFQYTDAPSIYDDTFWFRIDNYIIPTLLEEDHNLRNEGETLFEIPFKNPVKAYREILDRLQRLEMPVLFLPHLKKITWREDHDPREHVYNKSLGVLHEINRYQYNLCAINDNGKKKRIILFNKDLRIGNSIHKIYVGYFLDANYNLIVTSRPKIYCFFPTGETFDGCFVSHAPFLLTDNRESIKTFEDANNIMLEGIANLAAEALIALKEINVPGHKGLINENLFSIINVNQNNDRNILLREKYVNVLNNNAIIPGRGGHFLKKGNAIMTTAELEALLSDLQLGQLYRDTIGVIQTGVNRTIVRTVAESIGIRTFSNEDLATKLTGFFMSKQTDEWIDKLLNYIEDNAKKLWFDRLASKRMESFAISEFYREPWEQLKFRFAPITKTSTGSWIAPYRMNSVEPTIMLPVSGFDNVDPSEFGNILDSALYEKHQNFFDQLGLRKPNTGDYLEKVILPKYKSSYISEKDMQNDFQAIYKILSENHGENVTKIIKENLKLRGYNAKGRKNCTLSSLYVPNENLKEFVSLDTAYYFFDYDFYVTETFNPSKEEISSFLSRHFGISNTPKVIVSEEQYQIEESGWYYKTYKKDNPAFPLKCKQFIQSISLSQTFDTFFRDFDLDGYDIDRRSEKWSHELWSYLSKMRTDSFVKGVLCYRVYHGKTTKQEYFDSSLLEQLKKDAWIFYNNDTYYRPCDITLDEFHELGYSPSPALELSLEFCRDRYNSITFKEERERLEQEEAERNSLISQAKNKGLDVNEILRDAIERRDMVSTNIDDSKSIEAINIITSNLSSNEIISLANRIEKGHSFLEETAEIPEAISNNIDSLMNITTAVGEENLPYVAEHVDDIMDWIVNEDKMPSMVRRIINYLGRCIYEQYLINEEISYETCEDTKSDCDFCLNDGQKYVRVITTLKSIKDNKIPIGLSASQNAFIRNNPEIQVNIIRISLADISVLYEYNRMINIYGKEQDPEMHENLQEECRKIAKNYWREARIGEFDSNSPEYAITIERKNR